MADPRIEADSCVLAQMDLLLSKAGWRVRSSVLCGALLCRGCWADDVILGHIEWTHL